LARELGLVRVSVRDLINEEIKNNIELGSTLKRILAFG